MTRFLAVLCLYAWLLTSAQAVIPANVAESVGFDQHPGLLLPLASPVYDESGRVSPLRRYFGSRPVLVIMAYYSCSSLCDVVIGSAAHDLDVAGLQTGRDLDVVVVSINPQDTPEIASAKKTEYFGRYPKAGWHFLTAGPDSIARLAQAVGFRYYYDKQQKQYAHAAGLTLATADGRVSSYLLGVQYRAPVLRQALSDAAAGRIEGLTHRLLLLCFHFDPSTGRYTPLILRWVQVIGSMTAMAIAGFVFLQSRRERATRRRSLS